MTFVVVRRDEKTAGSAISALARRCQGSKALVPRFGKCRQRLYPGVKAATAALPSLN